MERRGSSASMDEQLVNGGKGSKKSSGRHDQLFTRWPFYSEGDLRISVQAVDKAGRQRE